MKKICYLFIALIAYMQTHAAIRYVDIAATGANNGNNWTNASTNLQAMIDLASAGDSIYVARGTYQPAIGASYLLKEGIRIFGGFPHGGNPTFANRNWRVHQTILRGRGGAVRLFEDTYSLSNQTIIDGFYLTGAGTSMQGGIAYLSSCEIRFSNCNFYNNIGGNTQGRIFYMSFGAPDISNCSFNNNSSTTQGGIFYSLYSNPQINNCTFSNNTNTTGSGSIMYILNGAPRLNACKFLNNNTAQALLFNNGGSPIFINTVFAGNTGSAESIFEAFTGNSSAMFAGCLFYNNEATNNGSGGGIIKNYGSVVNVRNCTFYNNTASGNSWSSLFSSQNNDAVFTITNTIIYNNNCPSVFRQINAAPTPVYRYSIIQGENIPANNVSDVDPVFVNPSNAMGADGLWATDDDGLILSASSPAVNAGNTVAVPAFLTTDIRDAARIQNAVVEMGAYEYVTVPGPIVVTSPGATLYTVQASPVMIDNAVTVTNPGSPTLGSARISITGNLSPGDILSFTNTAGMGNITGTYNNTTGQLSLVSAAGTATLAQWQTALQSITYRNNLTSPSLSNRTITFSVYNGTLWSNNASKIIQLQAPPCQATSSTTAINICIGALPYLWNNQQYNAAGNYNAVLINAQGCDSIATLILTVNPSTTSTTNQTICSGQLPIQWNGITIMQAGTYVATLINQNGCDSTATIVLAVQNNGNCLSIQTTTSLANCNNNNGSITVTASGGRLPYQYSIDGNDYQTSPLFLNLASQLYTVFVRDADGIIVSSTVTIDENICVTVQTSGTRCGYNNGSISVVAGSGTAPYQYSLNGSAYQTDTVFNNLSPADYTIYVRDASDSIVTKNASVAASVAPGLFAGNDTIIMANQPFQLFATGTNNTVFTQFNWSPNHGLNNNNIQNPIATIDRDIRYTVTATNAEGCSASASIALKVFFKTDIYVPTAFTPNNDLLNDILRVRPFGISRFNYFAVYNRAGQLVFYTKNPDEGWDGRLNGKFLSTESFVWMAEAVGINGATVFKKGVVTMIR